PVLLPPRPRVYPGRVRALLGTEQAVARHRAGGVLDAQALEPNALVRGMLVEQHDPIDAFAEQIAGQHPPPRGPPPRGEPIGPAPVPPGAALHAAVPRVPSAAAPPPPPRPAARRPARGPPPRAGGRRDTH